MDKYLFMDLDDTIFQTIRKCNGEQELLPAANGRDGRPLSFMTARQREFLAFLDAGTTIIPTTARNFAAFNNVKLQFNHCVILNFGGVLLTPEKNPDADWLALVKAQSESVGKKLKEIFFELQEFIRQEGLTSTPKIISDFDIEFYIVIKNYDFKTEQLDYVHGNFFSDYRDEEFYLHFNDNNLCLIPKYLNKRYAVEYVIENYISPKGRPFMTIGMGDSLSDLSFMSMCDFTIVPGTSQISRSKFR